MKYWSDAIHLWDFHKVHRVPPGVPYLDNADQSSSLFDLESPDSPVLLEFMRRPGKSESNSNLTPLGHGHLLEMLRIIRSQSKTEKRGTISKDVA